MEAALGLLQEMSGRELEQDVLSCSVLISACEKGACWEAGLGFLWEMPRRSLQPELFSCDAAIRLLKEMLGTSC